MSLFRWIQKSFEDEKGNVSSKRTTAFYFTVVLITGLDFAYVYKSEFKAFVAVLGLHLTFLAIVIGIASIENVLTFFRIIKGKNEKNNNDINSIDSNTNNTSL